MSEGTVEMSQQTLKHTGAIIDLEAAIETDDLEDRRQGQQEKSEESRRMNELGESVCSVQLKLHRVGGQIHIPDCQNWYDSMLPR